MVEPERRPLYWRVSLPGRVAAVLLGALLLANPLIGTIALATRDVEGYGALFLLGLWGFFGSLAWACWWLGWHPSLSADEDAVYVVNVVGVSRLPWSEVEFVSAGYFGISFRLVSGRTKTAWAVQKANVSTWADRRTRADEVVEQLTTFGGAQMAKTSR